MTLDQATRGVRIIERHKNARPKTVVKVLHGSAQSTVVVKSDEGRVTRINAKNLSRYDLIED